MKIRRQAAASALATGAYAQSIAGYGSSSSASSTMMSSSIVTAAPSTSYTTVTYSDCPSMSFESMITVTEGVTATYCPECQMASSSAQPGHTTVYTTTYLSMCPTGMVPATYTVTESCSEATPTWTPGPSHIPQGFTVTTQQCDVCQTPGPVTVTMPCGCDSPADSSYPASYYASTTPAPAPAPAPASSGSTPAGTTPAGSAPAASGTQPPNASGSAVCEYVDGQPQAGCTSPNPPNNGGSSGSSPAPGTGSYAGSSPPASGGSSPAPAAGGSAGSSAPYPTASVTNTSPCPGPQCRAAADPGNTTGIEQLTGAAASLSSFGFVSSAIMAVVVGAFAFML